MPIIRYSVSILRMLKIRLQRVGRKHEPVFRVVVTDSKNGPKSGKFLEVIGSWDARRDNEVSQIKADRIKHWIANGAKLSDTLHNFFVDKKVISGKKINNLPKRTPIKKEVAPVAPAPAPAVAPVAPTA